MYNINLYEKYIFLEKYSLNLNSQFASLKKVNIIYYPHLYGPEFNELKKIFFFCKKKKYKLFIIDNFKLSVQIKAHGVYLSANNKNPINLKFYKKNFEVIGSAHNQKEYFFKKKQNCSKIFLSPIFYNKKYSINKILKISRFNLISKNWKEIVLALGGINKKNLNNLGMLKYRGFAFYSFLETIKNP